MTTYALNLKRVSQRFGRTMALDEVCLSHVEGRILGLIGLAGAGRTTLMHLLAGLDKPTSGAVEVLGDSPFAPSLRFRIHLALDPGLFDPSASVAATLRQIARLKGDSRRTSLSTAADMLNELGLTEVAARPVHSLTASLQFLLSAGTALIGEPGLILLDGTFDVIERTDANTLHTALRARAAQRQTIVVAGENLSALGDLCDDVALLCGGKLFGKATPKMLCGSVRGLLNKYVAPSSTVSLPEGNGITARETDSGRELLVDHKAADGVVEWLQENDAELVDPTFEEACRWILSHPDAMVSRSKLWGHEGGARPVTD